MLMPRNDTTETSPEAKHSRVSDTSVTDGSPDIDELLERLRDEIQGVTDLIAPVWPLRDYVAVNPWMGYSDRRFGAARRLVRSVSDSEMLMPLDYYQSLHATGQLTVDDIREAVEERAGDGASDTLSVESLLEQLQSAGAASDESSSQRRRIRTIAEIADSTAGTEWSELIRDDIGQFCGSYFDEGQVAWASPWRDLNLFQAWRSQAQINRRAALLGLSKFNQIAELLPHTPEAAVVWALHALQIPKDLWGPFLLCQVSSIPGWFAWAKYQDAQTAHEGNEAEAVVGLLAVRLTYDVVVSRSCGIRMDWSSLMKIWHATGQRARLTDDSDTIQREVLLRASELAYQRSLIGSLPLGSDRSTSAAQADTQLAQMVFCIDVRSERYRRHLEQVSDQISTYGFAGFFGVPVARQPLDSDECIPQVPALLRPGVVVPELAADCTEHGASKTLEKVRGRRLVATWWKQLQSSAASCFGFVETAGLLYGIKLLKRMVGKNRASIEELGAEPTTLPDQWALRNEGWSLDEQTDLAESILRGIGLTENFAPLVVLCGHASTVANNPLQASLDCGACCGHSGEYNARFAAALLNRHEIRGLLAQRGIEVSEGTWFTAGVHHTTTDHLTFPDAAQVPVGLQSELQQLQQVTAQATALTQVERLPEVGAASVDELLTRAADWSEVRPEWGLAGNAAFIVGPRDWTRGLNLSGRTFLHSYDAETDNEYGVLQQIMTAPLVVAHWINMQYYASSVDNRSFGSGSKTIHNVVGRFGVLSGNGGDLMTGLPLQSVSTGVDLQHSPLRLLAVLKAPRAAVEDILQRHPAVEDLVVNQWMNLVVCDHDGFFRYTPSRTWQEVPESHVSSRDHQESLASAGHSVSEPQMQGV